MESRLSLAFYENPLEKFLSDRRLIFESRIFLKEIDVTIDITIKQCYIIIVRCNKYNYTKNICTNNNGGNYNERDQRT